MKLTLSRLCFFAFIFLVFCAPKKSAERAFYYWKSSFEWQAIDSDFLRKLKVNKLYVKYFDVKWEESMKQIVPVARIDFKDSLPKLPIVPVVFITNESLQKLADSLVSDLAEKILSKIEGMNLKSDSLKVTEIQIDCDWTDSTRERYFRLLTYLKKRLSEKNILLSATIRLHQVKYHQKRGVPPIEKGLLMCYNMDSPKKINTQNSIFNLALAKNYLQNLDDYPLKLDVALPLFYWGVVFRQGNFKKLINNLKMSDLVNNSSFEKIDENLFRAVADIYLKNTEIYTDDLVRVEESNLADVEKLASYLADNLQNKKPTVILFHYDKSIVESYQQEEILQVFEAF
ncbi:MAG: hypothetical protein MUE81_10345 [Thermoflexibacter sp.]|jgi:hypothetical protein|nr:hypothetical protein [Thermoflexibacter sp.]